MSALPRLALGDIVDTTQCAWESPETDLADAMADVYVGLLSASVPPESAAAARATIAAPSWAPDELARLHAWANVASPANEPMDVSTSLDDDPEDIVPPFLVLFGTQSAPAHRAATAKKANVLSGKRPRPYMPPTVHFGPPTAPSKRTVELKKSSKAASAPAQARPKPPSNLKKVRVPLAEAQALHAASIAENPANVVCTFARCGYRSMDPHAHRKHMLSHATYTFVCTYCDKTLSSQKNLDNHVQNICKLAHEAAQAGCLPTAS